MTVLVTGARGNIGRRVVARLHAAGEHVRTAARESLASSSADNSAANSGSGSAAGSSSDSDSATATASGSGSATDLNEAVKGINAAFLYTTRGNATTFLRAAHNAGTQYVVLLSSPAAYEAVEYRAPIGRIHRAAEEAVTESGLEYTVLYPSWLATNAQRDWGAAIRAGQPVELPYPAAQCAPIHPDDVAEAAVDLLLNSTHRSRIQVLSGPESMRLDEAVATIGDVIGRPIPVREISREDALKQREPWLTAEVLESLLDSAAASVGRPALITNAVERITGHSARSLRDWIAENRADFEG